MGSRELFAQAGFEPRSSWSLPPEWLGLQAGAMASGSRLRPICPKLPFFLPFPKDLRFLGGDGARHSVYHSHRFQTLLDQEGGGRGDRLPLSVRPL
jgi:hypothetical protein